MADVTNTLTTTASIPLRTSDQMLTVTALPTAVPTLVICPGVALNEDGTVADFTETSTLTHTLTGRSIIHGRSEPLRQLAADLAAYDWTFDDVDHFTRPENAATCDAMRATIRDWQMCVDYTDAPVRLIGDDDEMAAARTNDPAHTLLREHIDWWLTHNRHREPFPADEDDDRIKLWSAHISTSVEGYGAIYLLAVLRSVAPDVADVAARELFRAWDSGELGEWVHQWGQELTAGQPLSLYGIPEIEPFVPAHDGGLPVAPAADQQRQGS